MTATGRAALLDTSAIRAVAFDGYGTLFRFEAEFARGLSREILERQGLAADFEAFEVSVQAAWGRAGPWASLADSAGTVALEQQLDGPVPEWMSAWEMWRRQYAIALAEHGLTGDPAEGANQLRRVLADAEAYPDAYETLERLDAGGYRLGLLSNADEDFLQTALSRSRLRFSVIQSSESLRVYKPHRAAFLGLCERLGCEPGSVLYVGDSPTADVTAALGAGLAAAWIRRNEAPYPDHLPAPDLEVASLAEIADALGAPRRE